MQLYVLRHGEASADWSNDVNRPLTTVGEQQIRLVARILRRVGPGIGCIMASPLRRSQQTAEIVDQELRVGQVLTTDYLLPHSDPRNLVEQLNLLRYGGAILTGHQPHLGAFVARIVGGATEAKIELNPGGLAFVDISDPIGFGRGVLRGLMAPQLLEALLP